MSLSFMSFSVLPNDGMNNKMQKVIASCLAIIAHMVPYRNKLLSENYILPRKTVFFCPFRNRSHSSLSDIKRGDEVVFFDIQCELTYPPPLCYTQNPLHRLRILRTRLTDKQSRILVQLKKQVKLETWISVQ